MSNHMEKARTKSSASAFLLETHAEETYTQVSGNNFKSRQFHNQNTQEESIVVNPATSVASTIFDSTGNFTEFVFDGGKIQKLRNINLQVTILNNDAGNLGTPVSDMLVDRVEYFLGERHLATSRGITNFILNKSFQTYDERLALSNMENLDAAAFDESAVLATATSKTFNCDITGPLRTMGLFLPGLTQKLRITVYWQDAATWAVSGTVDVTASGVKCIVDHTKLNRKNYDQEMLIYREAGVRLRYISENYTKHSIALTASTESNQRISNVSGLSSFMYVFCRDQSPTGSGLYTFKALDSLYLTDGSSNITGGSALTGEYVQMRSHKYLVSNLCTVHSIYPFFWCEDALNVYHNAANTGYHAITENTNAVITASATDATSQIEILSLNYSTVFIKGSTIIVERSM